LSNVIRLPRGGTGTLKVDGKVVSTEKLEFTVSLALSLDTVFNIGAADGTPVDDKDYQIPFKFEGTISKVTCPLDRPKLAPEDVKRLGKLCTSVAVLV
jgi:arylsulfatase